MTPGQLAADVTSWAERAGYATTRDADAWVLYSLGGELRYYVRENEADGWWSVGHASRGDRESLMFRAASEYVLLRHLIAVFGVSIRAEEKLPFLRLPFRPSDLALGFTISGVSETGFRTLSRDGAGAIAMAVDETLSWLTLVPLSHYLGLSVFELKEAFLDEGGSPLLTQGHYRTC